MMKFILLPQLGILPVALGYVVYRIIVGCVTLNKKKRTES